VKGPGIAWNGNRHFPHLVVTIVTFHICYTMFLHVKNQSVANWII
jgi:hypothetical protein